MNGIFPTSCSTSPPKPAPDLQPFCFRVGNFGILKFIVGSKGG